MGYSFSRYHGFGRDRQSALNDLVRTLSASHFNCWPRDYTCYGDTRYWIYIEKYGTYIVEFEEIQDTRLREEHRYKCWPLLASKE